MSRVFVAALLCSSVAFADFWIRPQTDTSTTTTTYAIGTDCNAKIPLRIVWTQPLVLRSFTSGMLLWSTTSSSCGDRPGDGDVSYTTIPATDVLVLNANQTTSTQDFTIDVAPLPAFAVEGHACGTPGLEFDQLVCGSVEFTGNGVTTVQFYHVNELKLKYDSKPPVAPVLTKLVAQDGAIRAEYSVASDVTTVRAQYRLHTDTATGDFIDAAEDDATKLYTRVTNLKNATDYDVRLIAYDASGNQSDPSDFLTMAPIRTYGFWGQYKQEGGTETGGCSSSSGLMPLLLVAVMLWYGTTRKNTLRTGKGRS